VTVSAEFVFYERKQIGSNSFVAEENTDRLALNNLFYLTRMSHFYIFPYLQYVEIAEEI
jgi:hypothetical protein